MDLNWSTSRSRAIERFEHHVVRFPNPAAGTVIHDPDRGVLLLWRHRFVTDTWGWELPAGGVDPGESLEEAAVREAIEEAGWRPIDLRHLVTYHPINGAVDQTFAVFLAPDWPRRWARPPTPSEAERIEWVPVDRVRDELPCWPGHRRHVGDRSAVGVPVRTFLTIPSYRPRHAEIPARVRSLLAFAGRRCCSSSGSGRRPRWCSGSRS